MNRNIERDLDRWTEEKLVQWITDAGSRYEMAGASHPDAYARVIVHMMTRFITEIAGKNDITPEEFGRRCQDGLAFARAALAKKRKPR